MLKFVLPFVAAISLTGAAQASTLTFDTIVNGEQEVITLPDGGFQSVDTGSAAVGNGRVVVDTDAMTFSVSLLVTGLTLDDLNDELAAAPVGPVHLHNAAADANGPIVVGFDFTENFEDLPTLGTPLGFSLVGLNLDESDITGGLDFAGLVSELEAGNIYFNVHTDLFAGGEIRGQLPGVDGVSEVPLPASGLLLAGAVGFGAWRGRKKKALENRA